jgi:uncharacterized protein (TIGR02145 family)
MNIYKFIVFLFLFLINDAINAQNVTNTTTGRVWMDKNLGASQVATSSTDALSYGSLFQWGRAADGHESRTSLTTTNVSSTSNPGDSLFVLGSDDWLSPSVDTLWQGLNGLNNPCPQGFRIPTEAEWLAEMQSWSSQDAAGAFGSVLKLSIGGARSRMSGTIGNVSTFVGYRSSDLNGADTRNLGISTNTALMGDRARADGNCVRCIMDNGSTAINLLKNVQFKISPNPASDYFTVSFDQVIEGQIVLFNISGQELLREVFQSDKKTIDLYNLKLSGVLIVKVTDKQGIPLFVRELIVK